MRRPFLDQPSAWATKRTGQSSIDAACAIERTTPEGRHASDWFILAAGLLALAALIAGVL